MKKYLMMGAAALLMGASFTSCSKDKDLYNPEANAMKFLQDYQAAFIKAFGTPGAGQTWGFGTNTAGSRMTRSGNTDGEYTPWPATHEYKDANGNVIAGANMNHNQWGSTDLQSMPFGGWIVPDPLTTGQKERVKAYFQANPNLSNYDPQYANFFVQQVYKGNPATAGSYSTEKVIAADGSEYTSDNMNLLTVGEACSHINDFNAGTCTTSSVLNHEGKTQNDEITLMVNVDDTSCFGYHETGSSNELNPNGTCNHNDKWALVSADVIDAWAAENGNPGEAVKDKWNRSFMGFDLAIKEGAKAYDTNSDGTINYADYSQAAESPKVAWDGEKIVEMGTYHIEYPDPNNEYWTVNVFDGFKDEYKTMMKDGKYPIGYLTTNKNFYIAADQVTMSQTISLNSNQVSTIVGDIQNAPVLKDVKDGDTYYQSVINLPRIQQLIDEGYLPVNNKSLAEWVKVGVSDGYFSDWIVTLTEAQRIGDTPNPPTPPYNDTPDYRIIAEDLTVSDSGNDFDFNDVVFDVFYNNTDETKAKIRLKAAGGTLPLQIRDKNNTLIVKLEDGYKATVTDMVNTGAGPWVADKEYEMTIDKSLYDDGIKIYVDKTSKDGNANTELEGIQLIELTAEKGHVAAKVKVDKTYDWCQERIDIKTCYPNFEDYVQNPANYWPNTGKPKWWANKAEGAKVFNK